MITTIYYHACITRALVEPKQSSGEPKCRCGQLGSVLAGKVPAEVIKFGGNLYQPILKGKKGEFEAWSRVSVQRRNGAVPLFELVSDKGLEEDLQKFATGLQASLHPGDTIAIDSATLDPVVSAETSSGGRSYSWLASQLSSSQYPFRPVLHLDDEKHSITDAVSAAAAMNQPLILRLGNDAGPLTSDEDGALRRFCEQASLRPDDLHILLDLGSIVDVDQEVIRRLAVVYLRWITTNGPWASVTLASGGFPAQITKLPKRTANRLPRLDADLWNDINSLSILPDLLYGDYGVRHPELSEGQVWNGPLPNLRYTTPSDWIVWREAKAQNGQPHSSFYDACASVTALPEYRGPSFSWGDEIIEQKSRRVPGPGAGTEWITYATNLHMEFVIDRLATLGAA